MENKIFNGKNCIEQMKSFNRKRFQNFTGLSDEDFKRKPDESKEDYRKRIKEAIKKKHPGLVSARKPHVDFKQIFASGDKNKISELRGRRRFFDSSTLKKQKDSADIKQESSNEGTC